MKVSKSFQELKKSYNRLRMTLTCDFIDPLSLEVRRLRSLNSHCLDGLGDEVGVDAVVGEDDDLAAIRTRRARLEEERHRLVQRLRHGARRRLARSQRGDQVRHLAEDSLGLIVTVADC